jgi:hypothetical protein
MLTNSFETSSTNNSSKYISSSNDYNLAPRLNFRQLNSERDFLPSLD